MDLIGVSFLGGLLGLDRRGLGQIWVSSPIIAAPLVAYFFGVLDVGIWVGLVTALLWSYELPVGSAIPPDDTVISTSAVYLAVDGVSRHGVGVEAASLGALLWCIPAGELARRLDGGLRRFNVALSRQIVRAGRDERERLLMRAQLMALVMLFLIESVSVFIAVSAGRFVLPWLWTIESPSVMQGMELAGLLVAALGIASGLLVVNRARAWLVIGGVIVVSEFWAVLGR